MFVLEKKNQIEEDSYNIFISDSLTNFNLEFSDKEKEIPVVRRKENR